MNRLLPFIVIIALLMPIVLKAQLKPYTFEDIDSLQKTEPKPILIFIYTDWCNHCKHLQYTSLKNKAVSEILHQYFYFLPFNAEEKRDIAFAGTKFSFQPTGIQTGIHELAIKLGVINGVLSFPTLVLLDKAYKPVWRYSGYLNAKELKTVLNQFSAKQ